MVPQRTCGSACSSVATYLTSSGYGPVTVNSTPLQTTPPLVPALNVVTVTVDNDLISSRIKQMRDGIEHGFSISSCAAGAGVFTPLVLQMMAVGEETGELDSLMFEMARLYEQQTDYSVKGLAAAGRA